MFFDIGWPELMLIGVVALVVIGPKDLPAALRVAGYWMRKARTMSREFHSSVEQMIREAELDEVQKELKAATEFNLDHEVNKIMDPVSDPAIKPTRSDAPDYLDTTPPPEAIGFDPPQPLAAPEAVEEPELPFPLPEPTAAAEPVRAAEAEPEPAPAVRSPAAEPSKP